MKTIVISAVNIRKGGTLTILKECLSYLSTQNNRYKVIALVHNKELCLYPNIKYIEMPWTIKSWSKRLYAEYVEMNKISKEIGDIDLWFSLHDTTPRVKAKRQAVYCQTSFPFYPTKIKDFFFDPKIPLFSLFTKYVYKINIKRNKYLVVQTSWLRDGFSKMFGIAKDKFIVARPNLPEISINNNLEKIDKKYKFIYPATADVHKNFQVLCEAAKLLDDKLPKDKFELYLTINGTENKYSNFIYNKYKEVPSIKFFGMMTREDLFNKYTEVDALVFPSQIETWGLPISEFMATDKPLLLSNLPYAHETSAGAEKAAFFDPNNPNELAKLMESLINNDDSFLSKNPAITIKEPKADNWAEIFDILIYN